MAPDRGPDGLTSSYKPYQVTEGPDIGDEALPRQRSRRSHDYNAITKREAAERVMAARAADPTNFTLRGILVGLIIGVFINFSNIYFGLQTGWISGMSMPSALISFGFFKAMSPYLKVQFSPVENVLVQSVAGSVGTMPLGCGFVGVIPALEFLLKPEEGGPLHFAFWKLALWAVGICLFGVVFAVPLRKQVLIKEKLPFPSGAATALVIGVLHGDKSESTVIKQDNMDQDDEGHDGSHDVNIPQAASNAELLEALQPNPSRGGSMDWRGKIKLLTWAFFGSAIYTVFTYFVPQVRNVPIFGSYLGNIWLWTLNPSPAYVGQGIIMGPSITIHMFLGAILGWAVLSPLAKHQGWAPGSVGDWNTGSRGWIVWVSLAIMLADSLVSLGWLILQPLIVYGRHYLPDLWMHLRRRQWNPLFHKLLPIPQAQGYSAISTTDCSEEATDPHLAFSKPPPPPPPANTDEELDAPPQHLLSNRMFLFWLAISFTLYFVSVHITFPTIITFGASALALIFALLLSIMGVRALGSTDLNPVSGISKLTQLVFSLFYPATTPNTIILNLLAGGISEAGALQGGDLLQDLKTGHLLGASPKAQFYGQLIASVVGAITAAGVYRLYTNVYEIPSSVFQVPTAYVWIFTARLVTGEGLPDKAAEAALIAALVFAVITAVRTWAQHLRQVAESRPQAHDFTTAGPQDAVWWSSGRWMPYVPGGIAVAVGMYNTPSFTIARTVGGLMSAYWVKWRGKGEESVVVLASGLILGEGLLSILNLGLQSAGVPHL